MQESYSNEPKKAINFLSDFSQKDNVWDTKKSTAEIVKARYAEERDFVYTAWRMGDCGKSLGFSESISTDTGDIRYKLLTAKFCHIRFCPICQWRRTMRNKRKFLTALPKLLNGYPTHRFLFLTLTVPNCHVIDLKTTISEMNKGWQRLIKRKIFKKVDGWVRSTEVTFSTCPAGDSHPHFHCMLMVKPSYFTRGYIKHIKWLGEWQECMRDWTITQVNIKAIKGEGGLKEVLKYSVKEDDLIKSTPEWLFEMTRQTRKLRFLATGGLLKEMLKTGEMTDQEMIAGEESEDKTEESLTLVATWTPSQNRYRADRV